VVSYHPNVQVVQKGPVTVTHVSSSSREDIFSLNTDQDMKNHNSAERVATMEGKPEVSRGTCIAGVPAIDATTSLTDTVPFLTSPWSSCTCEHNTCACCCRVS